MVDNLIRLFDSAEKIFTSNGIGILKDAESCYVTEERNGEFELEMVYPITGKWYSDIQMRRIIVAKSNPYSKPQPFRIYSITKPFNGRVTINAEHISYDLSGYPVPKFETEGTTQAVFDKIKETCPVECPFSFWSNKTTSKKYSTGKPLNMRSILGGVEGSILSSFGGGEYEFDGYLVKFWEKRGNDNNVTIRYGKNLTDLEQEENCSSVYTGVYPFWYSDNGTKKSTVVTLYEKNNETGEVTDNGIINVEGTFDYTKILTLDLSDKFTNKPKKTELREAAEKYIKDNEIGVPKVSLEISFEQLAQYKEYAMIADLEKVLLCDTVRVEFPALKVSAVSKCIKTEYDVLTDRYKKIELGESKSNLAATIANQSAVLNSVNQTVYGNSGGYVMMHSTQNNDIPDEILIMDNYVIDEAKKVWRWNLKGLSYSGGDKAYYAKEESDYEVAITMDGKINANFIKTGSLESIEIKCGKIQNGKYPFEVTSDGTITATQGTIAGFTIDDKSIHKGIEKFDSTSINGIYLGTDGIRLGSSDSFSVNLSGELTATKGKIAGFTIEKGNRTIDGVDYYGNVFETDDGYFSVFTTTEKNASGKSGCRVSVKSIDIVNPVFTQSIESRQDVNVSGKIAVGKIKIKDDKIYIDDSPVIYLDYNPSGKTIKATLTRTAAKRYKITLDSSVTVNKTFLFKVHYIWGDWATKSITVYAGQSESDEYVFGEAFWGFDDEYFINSGGKTYFFYESGSSYIDFKRHIEPYSNNAYDCGSPNYKWRNIYAETSTIGSSDRNEKKDILQIDSKYEELFDRLKPVTYKFKSNTSDRVHIGFVAQDIKETLDTLNIDSKDFAAYCEWNKKDDSIGCGLRYGEFVALNTYEIQKLKNRVSELEKLLNIKKNEG